MLSTYRPCNICFFMGSDLKKCSITSLAHQWILCSEWVPSEWESKQLIKIHLHDGLVSYKHSFSLHKTSIDGLEWCGLLVDYFDVLSCLNSFWRHPFTAEDPLVSRWCEPKYFQICSDEETNSSTSWMAWGWVNCKYFFIFESCIPFRLVFPHVMVFPYAMNRPSRCIYSHIIALRCTELIKYDTYGTPQASGRNSAAKGQAHIDRTI